MQAQQKQIVPAKRWFASKSEWAESQAAAYRAQIDEANKEHIPSSNWRAIQRKMALLSTLRKEESTWRGRATRYRAMGL